eukprot:COSAG03_NODE_2421_length_2791_cov_94.742571_4_plen_100_part_00
MQQGARSLSLCVSLYLRVSACLWLSLSLSDRVCVCVCVSLCVCTEGGSEAAAGYWQFICGHRNRQGQEQERCDPGIEWWYAANDRWCGWRQLVCARQRR